MIKAVIVEDSRLARVELTEQLKKFPEINIVGEAASFENALKVIKDKDPDLLFLDIHLPGRNGFELLQELDQVPAVLFTTAFDKYALQSFEYNTIDYLLKPIAPERLEKAIQKVANLLEKDSKRGTGILNGANRIFVRDGEKCWFITVADIRLIESKGNYAKVYFHQHHALLLKSLQHMENTLDPKLFIRVNRQQIINVNFIDTIVKWFGGKLRLTLTSGQVIEASRREASKINEIFGL